MKPSIVALPITVVVACAAELTVTQQRMPGGLSVVTITSADGRHRIVLEVEVQDRYGRRPLKLRLDGDWLAQEHLARKADAIAVTPHQWLRIALELDCAAGHYNLSLDGKTVSSKLAFAEKVETVERLVFRTGPWRGDVRAAFMDGEHGTPGFSQGDLPGSDQRAPLSVCWIDDVRTSVREGQ